MNTPISNNNFRSQERLGHVSQEETRSTIRPSRSGRIFLTFLWAICHFIFYILQQLAEIFAPLCLILGLLWKILPTITSSAMKLIASSDFQSSEIMKHANTLIPTSLSVAGHTLTATKLIMDGFLLLALTAACATLTAYLGRKI